MFKSKVNACRGSLLVEAIVVLGLIATFTPLLYKHVTDRRNDIDNINRANTLLFLQQKTEEWLKDPNSDTADGSFSSLANNKSITLDPSEISSDLSKFNTKYIIGIRREDVNGSPTYKALIVDKTATGSDLKAGKVANLIGTSAGIYSAMDNQNAWGVNGMWQEQISNFFGSTKIPSGSVIVTTEYSRTKEQQRLSELLIDTDLDMGEYDIKTEGDVSAKNVTASKDITAGETSKGQNVWATDKLCIGDSMSGENCIEQWQDVLSDDLLVLRYCNLGYDDYCRIAYNRKLNRACAEGTEESDTNVCGCSAVKAVYDEVLEPVPSPEVYSLTYGDSSENYEGFHKVICNVNQLTFNNISTPLLSATVAETASAEYPSVVAAYSVPSTGWYQLELKGESSFNTARVPSSGTTGIANGGTIMAKGHFTKGEILSFRGVKGQQANSVQWGGAGSLLFKGIRADQEPILGAGGGTNWNQCGGGILGGWWNGYGWTGTSTTRGKNKTVCCFNPPDSGTQWACNFDEVGATGGCWVGWNQSTLLPCFTKGCGGSGRGGTGTTKAECEARGLHCTVIIPGGIDDWTGSHVSGFVAYDSSNTANGNQGLGYASIRYCGPSSTDSFCQDMCENDTECTGHTDGSGNSAPYCERGYCDTSRFCSTNADCQGVTGMSNCVDGRCAEFANPGYAVNITNINTLDHYQKIDTLQTYEITSPGKYVFELKGGARGKVGGGYLTAEKIFSETDVNNNLTLTIKVAGTTSAGSPTGAAVGIQESINEIEPTVDDYVLVAGGGADVGAAGWVAGCPGWNSVQGLSFKTGTTATSSTCSTAWYTDIANCIGTRPEDGQHSTFIGCSSDPSERVAMGGSYVNSGKLSKGGSGLCANGENGSTDKGYSCNWTNGGNMIYSGDGVTLGYENGNGSGNAYVKIYYCGPDDGNNPCPDPLP